LNALVLGANGQLGSELARLLPGAGVTTRIHEEDAIAELFDQRRPDVVINCAAYNAVDRAETERDVAHLGNVAGPAVIAAACRRTGATLVHFSTNFVFDGSLDRPYVEADEPAPLSAYGESKLAGERMVFGSGARALVIRTAAVFGGPRSFPRRILERATTAGRIPVVSDQLVNPTYARDLAEATLELVESDFAGLVHVVGGGCAGWDAFARAALEEFGVGTQVESVPTEAFPTAARRPRNGCLDTTRFHALRPWREALHSWAAEVQQTPPHSWGGQGRGA
jgi:dTDP-4-dehydrorhamnose reductase